MAKETKKNDVVVNAELTVTFDADTKNYHKYVNNNLTKEDVTAIKDMIININSKTGAIGVYQVKNGQVANELNLKIKFVHGIGNK